MQPRVTVALATVWLVAGLVGGAVTLHLSHDQYSPATPRHHAEAQRDQTRDWKDHDPAEDQPYDLWIGSQRSISAKESAASFRNVKFAERDFPFEKSVKDIVSSKAVNPLSYWQRQLPNIAGTEFAVDKVDYGYKMSGKLSRETMIPPSGLLDDPFVADDTFQDQGPGSVEIYKLDLSKEKALLTSATTPSTNLPSANKSKAPKKTGYVNSKAKTTEIKSTTMSPQTHHRQSNFFEEQRTEAPSVNRDTFGVGGVPELQVGCEGLEASSSHKAKRSIDTLGKEEREVPASVLLNVTPVSLDLDYLSYDEGSYEEMDELFKLKKLESTTKGNGPNRGDMDANHLNSEHLDSSRWPEKLPVRGDLGKSILTNSSGIKTDRKESLESTDWAIKNHKKAKGTRESVSSNDDADRSHGRRLLWLTEANTEGFADGESEWKRARRSIDWGFGENEGVVSSNELQTVSERRRQHDMRYHQDAFGGRDRHRGVNTEIDNIRENYEMLLEQRRREEEETLRRMQQGGRRISNTWQEEEERRRDEMRRRRYEEYRRRTDYNVTPFVSNEETRRRQMEERQRQEVTARDRMQQITKRNEEERRRRDEEDRRRRNEEQLRQSKEREETRKISQNRRQEEYLRSESRKTGDDEYNRRKHYDEELKRRKEEKQRRLQEELARKREHYKSQQEAERRKEEEKRRQEDRMRNFSENDRRRLEDRRREWSEKRRQEEEDERRRQQPPSNLMRAGHRVHHPNDIGQRDYNEKKREQEERRREQKLQEYIVRNRPINVNRADRRSEEERRRNRPAESRDPRMNSRNYDENYRRAEEQRKRQEEEERKLQDYIKRNQPVYVPSRNNQSTAIARKRFEERRLIEEARRRDSYPDPGATRHRGPWAPTYIDPRSSPEEVRRRQQETARRLEEERRQKYETEERRKELAMRQREQEEERRQREERMREEAARREEETRREQSRRYEEERKRLEMERLEAERQRQQMLRERSKNEIGRTRPETTKLTYYYQHPRFYEEQRKRQDSRPIPSNLARDETSKRVAMTAAERERLEAEKRRREENRINEYGRKEVGQWRRQELSRLNSLPVSATILVRPGGDPSSVPPTVIPRVNFDNEIDFPGINPYRPGVQAPKFPVPPTPRPPAQSPGPCVWAVVQCCSPNNDRLVKCFESMGCPGINWDPNPCRGSIAEAAKMEVMKFYANA